MMLNKNIWFIHLLRFHLQLPCSRSIFRKWKNWYFLHFMLFCLCKTCLISRNLLLMHPGLTDICTISIFFVFPPSTHHLQGLYFDDENKYTTFTFCNQINCSVLQAFPLMTDGWILARNRYNHENVRHHDIRYKSITSSFYVFHSCI